MNNNSNIVIKKAKIILIGPFIDIFFYSLPFILYCQPYVRKNIINKSINSIYKFIYIIFQRHYVSIKLINNLYLFVSVVFILIGVFKFFTRLYNVLKTEYVISNTNVLIKERYLLESVGSSFNYDGIESVHSYISLFGRIFNIGHVIVVGKGDTRQILFFVKDPEKIVNIINDKMNEFNSMKQNVYSNAYSHFSNLLKNI